MMGRRLESWKEIASYLRRDVKTARRWERDEGLPVHRHHHGALASVYAYEPEIEAWRVQRDARAPILPRAPRRPPPALLGRDSELARLAAGLARARKGARQVMLVTGDIGIG